MKIVYHRTFLRRFKKLAKKEKQKTKKQLVVFLEDEFNPILNNHPLKGKFLGYRSINITGDLRAVYKSKDKNTRVFVVIDTHSNLYQ